MKCKDIKFLQYILLFCLNWVAVVFFSTATFAFAETLKNVDALLNDNEITINYEITKKCLVSIYLLNQNNEIVETLQDEKTQSKGTYTVNFNTANLADGSYFYQVKAKDLKNKTTEIFKGKIEIAGQTITNEEPLQKKLKLGNILFGLNLNKVGDSSNINGTIGFTSISTSPALNVNAYQKEGFQSGEVITSIKGINGDLTVPISRSNTTNTISLGTFFENKDSFTKTSSFVKTAYEINFTLNKDLTKNITLGFGANYKVYVKLYTKEKLKSFYIPLTITNLKLITPLNLKLSSNIDTNIGKDEKSTTTGFIFSLPVSKNLSLTYKIDGLFYDWKTKKFDKVKSTPTYDTKLTFSFGL